VSQWATRVKAGLPDFGYVQLGVYQVNPTYLTMRGSFNLGNPPGTTGALIPLKIAWLPIFGGAEHEPGGIARNTDDIILAVKLSLNF